MQLTSASEESIPCFIRKTYKILEDDTYRDIICWNEEGTAVVIRNPAEFAQVVLPTYFKHNNLNSFIRQLNMYDFHKKKTPDGEHVYYHELFQRGKKHLLKNIRRKSAENTALNNEKSRLGLELVRSKQDIASIVNENIVLKRIHNENMSTIQNLEGKINELSIQNQALWSQLLKYNEKEEALRSLNTNFKRDIPLAPLTALDINVNQLPGENLMSKIAQTTTRIPQFSNDMLNHRNWNFTPENFDTSNLGNYYGTLNDDLKLKRGTTGALKTPTYVESDYASDLSQQIVKNMDQELQYLKKLTSSNKRPTVNLSMSSSPDSSILGKRRIETDPGYLNSYDNLSKMYRPDNYLGLNMLSNPCKAEGDRDYGDE